jgi:hypothetical protein
LVGDYALFGSHVVAEFVVATGDVDHVVPAGKLEICLVATVCILARDGVVNLESSVLGDTERGPRVLGARSSCPPIEYALVARSPPARRPRADRNTQVS